MSSLSQLQGLSLFIRELQMRSDERAAAQHLDFNVFTIVLPAHDEVRLHTRFLHNLLDPQGTHGCGDRFLKLFFETLDDCPSDLNAASFQVWKEASTPNGQIDLLLESPHFGIAIENKIYAHEQPHQLARYATYLENQFPQNWLLFYLTLDGRESNTHEGAPYLSICYRKHILAWLDRCLSATYDLIPINQVLLQYRHLVRQLTGETLAAQAMKDIADHLIANPDLIRMRSAYIAAIEEVKKAALDRFAQSLIEELQPDYPATLREGMIESRFGADGFASIRLQPHNGPFARTRYQITIEHIHRWNALVIGIEAKWKLTKLTETEERVLNKLDELLSAACEEQGLHKAPCQKTWPGEFWPTGWHDLQSDWPITDEVITDLLDETKRTAFAKELTTKARRQIQLLEELHDEATKATS